MLTAGWGIHISSRAGCLRIAPHVYNREAEIDALLDVLREFMEKKWATWAYDLNTIAVFWTV